QLNNYGTIYDTFTQNKYFMKFIIDDNAISVNTFVEIQHVFEDAPLSSLNVIDVRFYDENGLPYNFNDIDHSFTLEIVHQLDRLTGNDYSSRRGICEKA